MEKQFTLRQHVKDANLGTKLKNLKQYTLRSGKPFYISFAPQSAIDGIPVISGAEFDYLKNKVSVTSHEAFLLNARAQDCNYQIIPDHEISEAEKMAKKYCGEIIGALKGKMVSCEVEESTYEKTEVDGTGIQGEGDHS